MKFFIDTEFVEDGKTIDLISIGIVADDGREYYALNYDCDWSKASDWVKENVLAQLPKQPLPQLYPTRKALLKSEFQCEGWRHKSSIAYEVHEFCHPELYGKPQFWAYYADYDWVCIAQLFGTMMDLPKGFPMYCCDLKQWCDQLGNPKLPEQEAGNHNALFDARWVRDSYSFLENYKEGLLE